MWHGPVTHRVILGTVDLGWDLSSRLLSCELAVVVHSLELHEKLIGGFLAPVDLTNIAVARHSLPFGWGSPKELLGTLGATVGLLLLQIPEKSLLELVELGQRQAPQPAR